MKKYLKIAALVAAIVLVAGILYFANAFCGNPVSQYLAQNAAEEYIEENYARLDVYVEKVAYSFKTGDYYARIRSESSIDTFFVLNIDWFGNVTRDDYEDTVANGWNTMNRLDQEYRDLTRPILESPTFPYRYDFGSGTLQFRYHEDDVMEYGIAFPVSELELDKLYDVRALGAEYGVLTVYLEEEAPSVERAAEMVLEIRKLYDEAGVPFRIIDLNLRHLRNEDGSREDGTIYAQLDYEDIYEEGLVQRVQAAHDAKVAYYAELDAANEK